MLSNRFLGYTIDAVRLLNSCLKQFAKWLQIKDTQNYIYSHFKLTIWTTANLRWVNVISSCVSLQWCHKDVQKVLSFNMLCPKWMWMLECDTTSIPKIKYNIHYDYGRDGRNMHTDSNAYSGCNCIANKLASGSPKLAHNMITPAWALAELRLRWIMWHNYNCSEAPMVPLNPLPPTLIINFQWQSSNNLTSRSSMETAGADAMKTTTKACILFCTATIQNFIQEEGEASSVFLHLSPQTGMTTSKR